MKKHAKGKKILMAMSGGVDSSVAAALLVEVGYDVTGAYMINYEDKNADGHGLSTQINAERSRSPESCWLPDYRDAVRVAAKLGIPLLKLDFKKEYKEHVLNYMYIEYKKGRTPNPDVMCNKYVKFGFWLDKMTELGFDYLATGHYADIRITPARRSGGDGTNVRVYELMQTKDENKDQTYFLHQMNQEQLSKTLFPLGDYTKVEVRKLAEKFELPTANKEESMGICFVGEIPMKEFLQKEITPKPGNIVFSTTGDVIGAHDGLAFYTIGQRQIGKISNFQFPISKFDEQHIDSRPLYVVEKNVEKNTLIVGFDDDPLLFKKEIEIEDMHWVSGQKPDFPLQCTVRLRHRQKMQTANCKLQIDQLTITFDEPQRAVTPGQFAVMYRDGVCLGGGVITG